MRTASLSLLTMPCLMLAVTPGMAENTLYTNVGCGPEGPHYPNVTAD